MSEKRPTLTLTRRPPTADAIEAMLGTRQATISTPEPAQKEAKDDPTTPTAAELDAARTAQWKADRAASLAARKIRREKAAELREYLRTKYLMAFGDNPVPLAVGIDRVLGNAVRPAFSRNCVKDFLSIWCRADDYRRAVAAGETRRHLDGTEAGKPTESERTHASQCATRGMHTIAAEAGAEEE